MSLDVNIDEAEQLNYSELHACIRDVASKKGFEEFEYNVEYLSGRGVNFISNVLRVTIKNVREYSTEDEGNENEDSKEVSVVVKTFLNKERQKLFHDLHEREVYFYERVIPEFRQLQNEVNIEDRSVFVECIYAKTEPGKEIIVFEDLNERGFAADKKVLSFEPLDYLQVSLILKELAKFHTMSYVYQIRNKEKFDKLKTDFKDVLYEDKFLNASKLRAYIFESFDVSVKEIAEANVRKKLEKVREKVLQTLKVYMRPGRYNVLCHGDCWMNNILFKHRENANQVCFIDFQATRVANPVTDIMYFMYLCTDAKFRSDNFQALQFVYYDSLRHNLKLYEIDVNDVYPRDAFENDVKYYSAYGLLVTLVELKALTTPIEEYNINYGQKAKYKSLFDLNLMDGMSEEIEPKNRLFSFRINDVIEESVANGVVDRLINMCNEINDT